MGLIFAKGPPGSDCLKKWSATVKMAGPSVSSERSSLPNVSAVK